MINCRPDGANTSAVYYCRGCTRLRLVTPLPKPWPLLTELFPEITDFETGKRRVNLGNGIHPPFKFSWVDKMAQNTLVAVKVISPLLGLKVTTKL